MATKTLPSTIREAFGDKAVDACIADYEERVNPLEIAEQIEFRRRVSVLNKSDHRERAIAAVVEWRLPFTSTHATFFELLTKCVSVNCPYCGEQMDDAKCAGGNSHAAHREYACQCGGRVTLCMPWDAISAEPPKTT